MPEEEQKFDAKAPEVVNPLAVVLEGKSPEEFLRAKNEPEQRKEPAEPEKKEEAKQPEQKPEPTDDDIAEYINFDPKDLTTKAGLPVSESSRQKFRSLQSMLKAKDEKLKAALKDLEQASKKEATPVEEIEAYKSAVQERDNFKKELDLLHFQNTEEWKSTFEKPIIAEQEKASAIINGLSLDEDQKTEVINLIRQAEALMGDEKNSSVFSDIVDKIATDYMKPSNASRFSRAMESLFELTVNRGKAYADKEKARQAIVESMGKKSSSAAKALQERLDLELVAFEKTDVGQLFKKTPEFDFDASSKANKQKILEAIRDFQVTGQITNDLADMVRTYVLKGSFEKEREFLTKNYVKLGTAVNDLLKENDELKKRISYLNGDGKQSAPAVKSSNGSKTDYTARSILGGKLDEILDRASR